METEITITRTNVTALLGWLGLLIGLIGGAVQYFLRHYDCLIILIIRHALLA